MPGLYGRQHCAVGGMVIAHERKEALPIEHEQSTQERLNALVETLLFKAEQAAQELDAVIITCKEKRRDTATGTDINREHLEKLPDAKGPIDRGGLKQLTAVLKDLHDLLGSEEGAGAVTVNLEDGLDEFAM